MARLTLALLCLLLLSAPVPGAELDDLYRGRTLVTGIRDDTRLPALPACLLDVLVKVSGDARLLEDPAARRLAGSATALATEFSYRDRLAGRMIQDEQGSRDRPYILTVSFDPAKVHAALQSLGRKPWTSPRPNLAFFLVIDNSNSVYVLSGDGVRGIDQREALAAASWQAGIPVTLPSEADLDKEALTSNALRAIDPASLADVTKRMGADLVLLGTLVWRKGALGWAAHWRLFDGKQVHGWTVKDASFDEAFRNALRGSALILSGNGKPQ